MTEEQKMIPKAPTSLRAAGKATWVRAWSSDTITETDYDAVLLLCKFVDERKKLETALTKTVTVLRINNDTNYMLNPIYKRLESLDRNIITHLTGLGMTPAGRMKLGMATDDKDAVDNFLDEFYGRN